MADWRVEYSELSGADRDGTLPPEDLERLAVAAGLLGLEDEVVPLRERALRGYLDRGDQDAALRCGFWCGFHLQNRGDHAQARGWLQRIGRLATPEAIDGPSGGLLAQVEAVRIMFGGDPAAALPVFDDAIARADRAGDVDGFTLGMLGRARCLNESGRPDEAAAAMDELMVHVVAGRVHPEVAGLAYCGVVSICIGRLDLRRAQEWTAALSRWVEDQEGMLPYRGTCLVHRAEVLRWRGDWGAAANEADDACRWLTAFHEPSLGGAHYVLGELARLRGDLTDAENAFARAGELGHDPQPGLGLLRLAQGKAAVAVAGVRRALGEDDVIGRPRAVLAAAAVEVGLAAGDLELARTAHAMLDGLVGDGDTACLRALRDQWTGALLLADGEPAAALPRLRAAVAGWQSMGAPYEVARARCLVARACAALGDAEAASMESGAARAELTRLGALADLALLDATAPPRSTGPLSPREVDVLRLLATGASNRAIAERLFLSEKTVARHLSNIYGKLDVPSRAAATAWAFENALV